MIKKFCIEIFLIIAICKFETYLCSIIEEGINQFNNFLYLNRLNEYRKQNRTKKCTLSSGPHCLYTEGSYISSKVNHINSDWIDLFNQINQFSLKELYTNKGKNITKYLSYIINHKDSHQSAPILEYEIGVTFERYDSITIKQDIYLEQRTLLTFSNEKVALVIEGTIRLKYDKQKIIVQNMMDFPSKTYGIIESKRLSISLDGRYFLCRSFFIRPHNKYNEDNKNRITFIGQARMRVTIEGYNNKKLVFSTYFEFAYIDEKHWNKINLPNGEPINKLFIPGGFEVDNFSFLLKGNYLYDIQTQYYSNPNRRTNNLITEDDIY